MTDPQDATPTLSEDEAMLATYSAQLGNTFEAVAFPWFVRLVESHNPGLRNNDDVVRRLEEGAAALVAQVYDLLQQDIADQTVGPLELLRRGIAVPSDVLSDAGSVPAARDEFARTHFPDDVYGLTPASFADVDPSLHEPGLTWGAAKAHVHLRRRREQPVAVAERVVVLSADLMDRSKISSAFPDATLVRAWSKLEAEAPSATLVLVDLGRVDDPAVLASISCRVVAFGSHVNDEILSAAEAVGAEALPRSVFFRRLETGDL